MKNLIYFILAITLLSASCCKKDDNNVTPVTKTPGQLHPEYLGKWYCDSVLENGTRVYITGNNYEFQNTSAIETNDNAPIDNVYTDWKLSGSTLTLYITDAGEVYSTVLTIVSPPVNNKMVLIVAPYTEYLTKH